MTEIEELWELIDQNVTQLPSETVPLLEALGRTVSEDVRAAFDFPAFDHSAVDGYAFCEPQPGKCRIIEQVAAGDSSCVSLKPRQAARILTGAAVPAGTFAVAMQEDCVLDGTMVSLREPLSLKEGQNVRARGALAQAGMVILKSGEKLNSGCVAVLTSCHIDTIPVFRSPRVLHLATGSELLAPGEPVIPGKIPDSNGPMIEALLAEAGISCVRRRLRDHFDELLSCVRLFDADLLLISGGSGPGDHDHTQRALAEAGFRILSNRVNSRPGKPLILAVREGQIAFGLPGNPLSHWVCYQAFVRRALARLMGSSPPMLYQTYCPAWNERSGDGRRTWTPARRFVQDGKMCTEPLYWLHSGDLFPLLRADALLLDAPDPKSHLVLSLFL